MKVSWVLLICLLLVELSDQEQEKRKQDDNGDEPKRRVTKAPKKVVTKAYQTGDKAERDKVSRKVAGAYKDVQEAGSIKGKMEADHVIAKKGAMKKSQRTLGKERDDLEKELENTKDEKTKKRLAKKLRKVKKRIEKVDKLLKWQPAILLTVEDHQKTGTHGGKKELKKKQQAFMNKGDIQGLVSKTIKDYQGNFGHDADVSWKKLVQGFARKGLISKKSEEHLMAKLKPKDNEHGDPADRMQKAVDRKTEEKDRRKAEIEQRKKEKAARQGKNPKRGNNGGPAAGG